MEEISQVGRVFGEGVKENPDSIELYHKTKTEIEEKSH